VPFDLPAREAEAVFEDLADRGPLPWLVRGLVFAGGVTLLSGPPKKGKSTLVSQLAYAHLQNERFLYRDTTPGPVLVLSEEGEYPFAYRWQRHGGQSTFPILKATFDPAFEVVFYADVAAKRVDWDDVLVGVSSWVAQQREARPKQIPLVIIDTLAVWAGIEDENDSAATTAAVSSVTSLAQSTSCAVILVHHTRKGGGAGGEGIRGSSAIYATVDVSIEFRVPSEESDNRRLVVTGRVVLPSVTMLEFDRSTLAYMTATDEVVDALPELRGWLAQLPTVQVAPGGVSVSTAMTFWNMSKNAARSRLQKLTEKGLAVELEPRLIRGNPTQFWLPLHKPAGRILAEIDQAAEDDN
jgi:hypothetical protein